MNNLGLLCLFWVGILIPLEAQVTINNSVFPAVGDTLHFAVDDQPSGIVMTPPDFSGQQWDFSNLQPLSTFEHIYQAPGMGADYGSFPSATLLFHQTSSPDVDEYLNVSTQNVSVLGFSGPDPAILGLDLVAKYNPPIVRSRAPVNFLDFNQTSTGVLLPFLAQLLPGYGQLPFTADSMRIRISLNRLDAVDAWGTLTIPGGTFDVLRQKSTEYRETRLDAKIAPLGWLDVTDLAIQYLGLSALGVDTTVTFHFLNDQSKEEIALCTTDDSQLRVISVQFKDVNDNNSPPEIEISCPDGFTVQCLEDVPACNANDASATSNCGAVSIACSQGPLVGGECGGTLTNTYTATDACGNSATCTQVITIEDTTPPIPAIAPANVTSDCAGDIPPALNLTAMDNCDGPITVSPTDQVTPGDCPNDFTILRTWTFTDKCGNSSSSNQTIIVNDTVPPRITCPADKTILCGQTPTFDAPTVVDNCGEVSLFSSTTTSSVDECGNGTLTLVRVYADPCGNTAECTQRITITDCGDFNLLKTTDEAVDPTQDWHFTLSYGNVEINASTLGDGDGVLFDHVGPLSAGETYTVCETDIPSGFSAVWKIDADGDGIPETIVSPVNPDFPQDLGTRCFQFGADTPYPLPIGNTDIGCTLAIHVDNSFPGGEPRSPGFWKNWSSCSGGNQVLTAANNGGCEEGFCTLDDILNDPGMIWCGMTPDDPGAWVIDDCAQAVDILDARDHHTGKKMASDAAYTLARALLAAQLNFAAGAATCPAATQAALAGEALLCAYAFDGTGNYLKQNNNPDKAYALCIAATLDAYNNGSLCPDGSFSCNASLMADQRTGSVFSKAGSFKKEVGIVVYPNPSHADVTIEFAFPEDAPVTLEIFNLIGERVALVFDGEVKAGLVNTVIIKENTLSQGTYLYRLSDGEQSYHGKLIIIK